MHWAGKIFRTDAEMFGWADDIHLVPADRRTRKNHPHKFRLPPGNTPQLKNSFVNRTVPEWNKLPSTVIAAESADAFKARLNRLTPVSD